MEERRVYLKLSRPSFREAFRRAAEQTELQCADREERNAYRELCYIMAEVYILDDDREMEICGESLPIYAVKQVFEELRFEHLTEVLKKFDSVSCRVNNKKAYLRAALYNAVFELEAGYTNETNIMLFGGKDETLISRKKV